MSQRRIARVISRLIGSLPWVQAVEQDLGLGLVRGDVVGHLGQSSDLPPGVVPIERTATIDGCAAATAVTSVTISEYVWKPV